MIKQTYLLATFYLGLVVVNCSLRTLRHSICVFLHTIYMKIQSLNTFLSLVSSLLLIMAFVGKNLLIVYQLRVLFEAL